MSLIRSLCAHTGPHSLWEKSPNPRRDRCSCADRLTVCAAIVVRGRPADVRTPRTIQLALRQSPKDPIVKGLSNYGNLINLFSSSPLTAFVSARDLLRDLCELHPIEGVCDEDSVPRLSGQIHFKEALK